MESLTGDLNLNETLGALLIGLIVSTALFGLTTLQTYLYFNNENKDRTSIRWFVALLWILDFFHTILISHAAYHFLVQEFAHPQGLLKGEWSIILEVGVTTTVTVLVQCFLAHRVYRLSHGNWFLTICILFLTLGHATLGTTSTVRLFQIGLFSKLPDISNLLSATLIVMAVNDVLITSSLCFYLYRTQSYMSGTHDAVRILILYSIETGLLTSVVVTIDAVLAMLYPKNWIFIGIELCLSKLYANSLLTILNSRSSVRNKFRDVISNSHVPKSLDQPIRFASLQMQQLRHSTSCIHPDDLQASHISGQEHERPEEAFVKPPGWDNMGQRLEELHKLP